MFSLESCLDLPLVWFALIATALFLYIMLDGFDLGVGVLFPFAPSDQDRDRMMNSIAPFWDGNETWLVLSGGGLFAAFPLAYAILMPALYMPVILMLLGLIFRGVAFEFRFKSVRSRPLWDYAFHFGSIVAAFMQGTIIGAAVRGVQVEGRAFAGQAFDWLSAYSFMTGVALVFGYALLGAVWLVMKTDGDIRQWARKCAAYVLVYVGFFLVVVSISVPLMNPAIRAFWFSTPNFFYLLPIPAATAVLFAATRRDLSRGGPGLRVYLMSVGVFLTGYLGLGISLWPWMVPYAVTFREAAAAPASQSFLLVGTAVVLPLVLAYVAYCYYIFRGKVSEGGYY